MERANTALQAFVQRHPLITAAGIFLVWGLAGGVAGPELPQ